MQTTYAALRHTTAADTEPAEIAQHKLPHPGPPPNLRAAHYEATPSLVLRASPRLLHKVGPDGVPLIVREALLVVRNKSRRDDFLTDAYIKYRALESTNPGGDHALPLRRHVEYRDKVARRGTRRSRKMRQQLNDISEDDEPTATPDTGHSDTDGEPDTTPPFEDTEGKTLLECCLMAGMTHEQTAKRMGCGISTVSTMIEELRRSPRYRVQAKKFQLFKGKTQNVLRY